MKRTLLLMFPFLLLSVLAIAKTKKVSQKDLDAKIQECKMFKMERITLSGDSIRTDYCMTGECNTFISWVFDLQTIDQISLKSEDENYFLHFECQEGDCIRIPVIGTIYSPKHEYDMYIKSKEEAKELLDMIKSYKNRTR